MNQISSSAAAGRESARQHNGRFGHQHRAEATGLALSTTGTAPVRPPLREKERGHWEIVNATTTKSTNGGITRTVVSLGGRAEVRNRTGAAAKMLLTAENDQHGPMLHRLHAATENGRQKATVLIRSRSGDVEAIEGTLFTTHDGGVGILPKGKRSSGLHLTRSQFSEVLAFEPGYGGQQQLADTFHDALERVPATEPVAFDGFTEVPKYEIEAPINEIHSVYMVEGPDFGAGPAPGCLFMVTDRQAGAGGRDKGDILNGYFWAPRYSGLYSESSSMYAADLSHRGARLSGYQPGAMDIEDAIGMDDEDRATAYARFTG